MICCKECGEYDNCLRKWILAEKGLEENCCADCNKFSDCFGLNCRGRWGIIHPN